MGVIYGRGSSLATGDERRFAGPLHLVKRRDHHVSTDDDLGGPVRTSDDSRQGAVRA